MRKQSTLLAQTLFFVGLLGTQASYALASTDILSATVQCDGNKKFAMNQWIRQFDVKLVDGKGTVLREGVDAVGRRFKEVWDFDVSAGSKVAILVKGSTNGVVEGHDISFIGNVNPAISSAVIKGQQRNGGQVTRVCEARVEIAGVTFGAVQLRIASAKRRAEELRLAQAQITQRQSLLESRQVGVETRQSAVETRQNTLERSAIITKDNSLELNKRIANLDAQINLLAQVLREQRSLKSAAPETRHSQIDDTINAVSKEIERLKKEYSERSSNFNAYLTSIHPNDRNLYLTARKAAEFYPRIPYYIPGTSETGEFSIEPTVSNRGEMLFKMHFIDIASSQQKIRSTIEMSLAEVQDAQASLLRLHEWSAVARKEKIRRNYSKRVTCFPISECPADDILMDGKASTEIRFNIYEDGSTAGRIQRNKGRFVEGYNVSIESALLLQAYLNHVIEEAKLEFRAGTQDKTALDKLFK